MIAPVVDISWLGGAADGVVLADVRWYLDGRSGHQAYDAGHIPGAVFVDLDDCLAGPPSAEAGRHPLPEPAAFAQAMSELGIGDETVVLAYDDAGGVTAARLVWMLRATGHDAALVDGGLAAYGGALEVVAREVTPCTFSTRPWPTSLLADIDEASDPSNVVIDARAAERYRGDQEPVDARAGHIPGAVSLPCGENLAPDGRFLPVDALRQRFLAAGVAEAGARSSTVVSYCGSGVTACHNLLALEHAGLPPGRLYPGSWSQYSCSADRPVATI